jgi:hypothetical protein
MDSNIPDRDILAYRSRVEKLNWDNVSVFYLFVSAKFDLETHF